MQMSSLNCKSNHDGFQRETEHKQNKKSTITTRMNLLSKSTPFLACAKEEKDFLKTRAKKCS